MTHSLIVVHYEIMRYRMIKICELIYNCRRRLRNNFPFKKTTKFVSSTKFWEKWQSDKLYDPTGAKLSLILPRVHTGTYGQRILSYSLFMELSSVCICKATSVQCFKDNWKPVCLPIAQTGTIYFIILNVLGSKKTLLLLCRIDVKWMVNRTLIIYPHVIIRCITHWQLCYLRWG